ncbi:MAG: M67 family metallopeptidase [Acidobacteria bacterium]|nr:M67 family metallopeptidase [Acidobacteriota bacterium]
MQIRQAALDAIRAHALRDSPHECCGLLIGTSREVIEAVATTNVAADPLRRFEVSPPEHLAEIRRCREARAPGEPPTAVIGVYHSHPHSGPEPSPTDVEQAFEEFLYVIAGPVDAGYAMEVRGYRLRAGRLEPAELFVS